MITHNKINWPFIFKFSWKNILFSLSVTVLATVLHFNYGVNSWQIPMAIIATLGTALAIILGFRNGSAYDRWWEARKIWGGMVNDSRSYARQVLSMINLDNANDPETIKLKEIQRDIVNTHIGFINALKLQLRGIADQDMWNDKVYSTLNEHTLAQVRDKSNKATQLLIQQGKKLEDCQRAGLIDDFRHMQLDNTLTRFSDYQGKSERIKGTPFPKAYELFNSILLDLFILFLPFALLPIFDQMNGWWLVFPITVMISWAFYSIHRLGILIANPFENFRWDVPLDAICNTIEIDMLEAVESDVIPEKLKPVDGVLM
ncbi:bestrophin family protein [Fulvivirga sedimenti]|uniref:Hydrogenase n=1 Tax=Fulvivirga sedimenti TaxID=2879465 RepID=A0A9X1HUY9_9BACT|nr:bestrophin family ion channel [Fulvivirga sedimenti]MCA6074644.1 hypothetical protein [Fulvivirga sedimenti]MCA6075821.1 hypothetical protein [Fulvivirga sedimenti]MCA6076949.1 hypothetical protein [Fulvivirga sedimenti]